MTAPSDDRLRHRQVQVGACSLHVVESGDPGGPPYVLLHGWPESSAAWAPLMAVADPGARLVALDLPGTGGSRGDPTDGSKRAIAQVVHGLVSELGLERPTLVGHDAGGMVVYAYLRQFADLRRAVVMNTVVPGVPPWERVLANPSIWHFAFHAVPRLPELLVQGRQADYFAYFYDVLAADPSRVTPELRTAHAAAHSGDDALRAGLSWYRTLPADAADNERLAGEPVTTPLLYLRGEHEPVRIGEYVEGLRAAGLADVTPGTVAGAGHFAPEEAPEATWALVSGAAA